METSRCSISEVLAHVVDIEQMFSERVRRVLAEKTRNLQRMIKKLLTPPANTPGRREGAFAQILP